MISLSTPESLHCEHECVCSDFAQSCFVGNSPCLEPCKYDTRATSQSNTPDDVISALITENCRIDAELKRVTKTLFRLNGEHDAALIAQVREGVLDAVLAIIRKPEKEADNPNGWLWKQPVLVEKIESLRLEMKK